MSDDTRFKILTDFMMKSMDEEEEDGNLVETDRASASSSKFKGKCHKKTVIKEPRKNVVILEIKILGCEAFLPE
jgi:hypothetical protein